MKTQVVSFLGPAEDKNAAYIAEMLQQLDALLVAAYELAPGEVSFHAGATVPDGDKRMLGLFDTPDVAGAMGYHDIDPRGIPYGKAFRSTVPGGVMLHDPSGKGVCLAAVAAHEYAELRLDLFANLWAYGKIADPSHPRRVFGAVAYETADPVQDFAFPMKAKDGTVVDCSDFVLPNWFNPDTPASVATSHSGKCLGPFRVCPGGYAIVSQAAAETQVFGRLFGKKKPAHEVLVHADTPPPAWREAIRALPNSRANRRAKHLG